MKRQNRSSVKKMIYSNVHGVIAIILGIALIVGSLSMAANIQRDMRDSAYDNLRNVSVESAKAVQGILQSRLGYLMSVWMQLRSSPKEERRAVLERHQKRSEIYGFDWIGCTDASGEGIKSNGGTVNLSKGTVFQGCMEGRIGIAQRPVTHSDGAKKDGILVSIPLYVDGGDPVGCLYQSFSPKNFSDLLEVGAFDGNAYITLLGEDGSILAATEECVFTVGDNVLDTLNQEEYNKKYVAAMESAVSVLGSGGGYFVLGGTGWYSYYTPITLSTDSATVVVGVMSIVPEAFVNSQIKDSFKSVIYLVGMVSAAVLLLGIWLVWAMQRNRKELERLAYQDFLTGGNNYEAFKRDFENLKCEGGIFIICDLVEFKLINRYYGAEKGDSVLCELSKDFAEKCGSGNLTARVSDDQFTFFYPDMTMEEAPAKCMELKEQVLDCLKRMKVRGSGPVFGYCFADGSESVEKYRSMVMFAKSLAKKNGTVYWAYDEKTATELTETLHLLNTLEQALREGRIEVWYQPKYLLQEKRISGAEALARWRESDGSLILPVKFVPLLEEYGKISVLDEYVFSKVCAQKKKWEKEGIVSVPVSVNVSRNSLIDPELPRRYAEIADRIGVDRRDIYLEITEESVRKDVMGVIRSLREEGFCLLMDDFGRSDSNLANLQRALFSGVKIDKSLIELIGTEEEALLSGSMRMIRELGMWITAEGVELKEESDFLEEFGCDEIQGFLYYHPMEEEAFLGALRAESAALR